MKIYEVIFKDRQNAYVETIPSKDKARLLYQWGGNGEVIRIKDITEEFTTNEHLLTENGIDCLINTLKNARYGQQEIDIIVRTLREVYNI